MGSNQTHGPVFSPDSLSLKHPGTHSILVELKCRWAMSSPPPPPPTPPHPTPHHPTTTTTTTALTICGCW
ncbi:hypothetical protein INR49_004566 [Caranx melampygus]|nr:hypothetical protein INR49_004566 [Caranx melampygus]